MLTNRSVVTVIILTIVTCGIYGWYWVFKASEELENAGQSGSSLSPAVTLGRPASDNKVLYMILGFIFPIVLIALVQNEMNQLAGPAQPMQ